MSVASHVAELKRKHQHLANTVEEAQRSPATDNRYITDLKKQKLKLKEEIERLQH
jgi:hypothetical protein